MSLEPIIRPFVDVSTDPKPGVATLPAAVPNVVVMAGAHGSGKVMHGEYSETVTLYVIRGPQEVSIFSPFAAPSP